MNGHMQEYYGPGPLERHSARRDAMPRKPVRRGPTLPQQPYEDYAGAARQKPHVSLPDAMMDLYDALKHAERYYGRFREDFETDIVRIKTYARSDVLGYLWASKVGESDNPRARERAYAVEPYDAEDQALKEGFRATGKQVGRLFKVAITAADKLKSQRPGRESRIDSTNAARIGEKLKTVYKDVTALLVSASRRVEDVQYLLTDLEMAATFLKGNGEGRARMGEDGRGQMQDPGVFDENDDVHHGGHVEGGGKRTPNALEWHPLIYRSRRAAIETKSFPLVFELRPP